jgi:hypothetical protein
VGVRPRNAQPVPMEPRLAADYLGAARSQSSSLHLPGKQPAPLRAKAASPIHASVASGRSRRALQWGRRDGRVAVDDQQRPPVGVLRVHLRLGRWVEIRVSHLGESDAGAGNVVLVVELLRLLLVQRVRPAVLELSKVSVIARPRVRGLIRNGPTPLSTEPGGGRAPRRTPGSIATVTAERPRPASICASRPSVECPITAGFSSNALMTSVV